MDYILVTLSCLRDHIRNGRADEAEARDFLGYVLDNVKHSRSQIFQDLWVLWELGTRNGGYFVEFGAHDGISFSNSLLLEERYHWQGLLAEPNPDYHDGIARHRKAAFDRRCVYRSDNESVGFDVVTGTGLSTIAEFSSADINAGTRQAFRRIEVRTVTLDSLLDEHGAPGVIDYLSIDTEGSELEILSGYSWSRRIRCITVEHNYNDKQGAIHDLLVAKGYVRRFRELSAFDGWYVHRDELR